MPEIYHSVQIDFSGDIFFKLSGQPEGGYCLEQPAASRGWKLNVDVYENKHSLIFVAELAGVTREELKIMVNEDTVRFLGYRGPTCSRSQGFYHRMEIATGHFSRSFSLPLKIWPEQSHARVADGMLYLILTKKVESWENNNPLFQY